ncbi:SagB/ThcOx family dehydrogenase [Legionella micdadei]|uniref:Nitroreductase family protein n=2 Tax=Legionella micdadei TaxID=451 RepID=A0A098GB61_LEGMI|nr:SagB/ThcOx family dehydrogenase [Legionella micdadei]ARG96501.1 nitroreductase [Legionella micdadei]ARG99252.1 nitroreductase [Legionella micdadei]KTD27589.1 putative nitroreductase [Legionella micdadei]NSL19649.1 SagB/ThcOx family dehydrogenase [Legionella micdadei]CEG59724.1 Nitroreductase family protein [Legionella micdadei]
MEFLNRKSLLLLIVIILICLYLILTPKRLSNETKFLPKTMPPIEAKLPAPVYSSQTSIEDALKKRRSIRTYKNQAITLSQVAQLLWAAQGITSDNGFRTTPSAGALYPLEVYLVARDVNDLSPGVYHYLPTKHALLKIKNGDISDQLTKAALEQEAIKSGAANIVITAVFSRTTKKYGEKGKSFVFMEAGHAAQNIYLQTVSLNLGTVTIGAFDEPQVRQALNTPEDEIPLYILPIGGL